MYVLSDNILMQIMREAQADPDHQMLLKRCQELETAYCAVMEALPEAERMIVDDYFVASCQMQLDLLRVAYRCGMRGMFPMYPRA